MTISGILRIKNESRWIERVIRSIIPVCQTIHIFDDHSDDNTVELCQQFQERALYPSVRVKIWRSVFSATTDEARDKNFLLDEVIQDDPDWVLAIDGDEELEGGGTGLIKLAIEQSPFAGAFNFPIVYLWDSPDRWRTDGVYRTFRRPSLYNVSRQNIRRLRYRTTTCGGNLHCSNLPENLDGPVLDIEARLLHYGYIDAALRRRKYEWYNAVDPNNYLEDCYRHCIQGDPGGPPADVQLRYAGPLMIEDL